MADPGREIWSAMLAHMRRHHVGLCRRWFDDIEPIAVDRGALVLRVEPEVRQRYLERECADAFKDAAQAVTGMLLSVRFIGADDAIGHNGALRPAAIPPAPGPDDNDANPAAGDAHEPTRHAPSDRITDTERHRQLPVSPDYTFDSFVVGPENRLAHAASIAIANNPGKVYNPVFLHGGVGLGKTHLLQAICLRILESAPDARIHYISCDEFVNQFMESVEKGQMAGFRRRFRDVDVLVIDDIHFLAGRDRSQEEFFHTFNALYQANKQVVVSSDAPPDQIPHLEQRLVSRFKWGMVAELEPPGYDTRVAIISKKAELRGVHIPNDVAKLVAQRIQANIRELEGAIVRLQMQATVEERPLDLALAHAVLGEAPSTPARQIRIATITDAVTEFYSVKLSDLQSKRRHKSVSLPRQVCMFLARRHTSHSLEEIGAHFGGRDHTTVMHAVRTIAARVEADEQLKSVVLSLEREIVNSDR
ncbi:MAG: chromosomal replication initiator protein DnaA [Phycisphaerales bacterium]|nr:MAG: chromosomal replication initiator protein DnaA [Phycisphaerales bacterium]